ncbi:UPF0690 protein C1orf52 homolog [Salarias fasciatus]|uniref:CA052 protein n=1 Tax=Salarias fasciatus TaxID=181472 RepID=A0A672HCW2_SALFA|nr:UPF0690 protein C1orf52 homolog [Salarias fasciatus]
MTEEKKPASMGFFSSYDDLSDSSSDSDEERGDAKKKQPAAEAPGQSSQQGTKRAAGSAPLPRPDELFSSVSKPAFLYNPLNKEIDWDSLTVKAPEEPAKEFKPWKTNAVPPPESYTAEPERKKGPPPGMDMAIKWSNVYEDNGDDAPQPYTGKARFLPTEEQPSDSDEESADASALSAKKRRVETFQQKEKRKRDLGQATSDKNFVEEEKRILRQKLE